MRPRLFIMSHHSEKIKHHENLMLLYKDKIFSSLIFFFHSKEHFSYVSNQLSLSYFHKKENKIYVFARKINKMKIQINIFFIIFRSLSSLYPSNFNNFFLCVFRLLYVNSFYLSFILLFLKCLRKK